MAIYLSYFGLAESPFSGTPDRRFVYLSDRHREGLAHLGYGLREQGGFVQLTGEVGTGKTTLCRYLLEQLPGDVDVALILNPALTAVELLATMCDELRVSYPEGTTSLKTLGAALYRYLLNAHERGRRTVLIIDEAQNLSVGVLEQLRLLTNLETASAKLLQIILIGQPELVQLLARPELRQVAQRVAARYHLRPLSERETRTYVLYRLQVAGQAEQIFEDRALHAIHRFSGGVPRLINILADRALLGAYAVRQHDVTAAVVKRAAREVFGEEPEVAARRPQRWVPIGAAALVVVAMAAGFGIGAVVRRPDRTATASAPSVVAATPAVPPPSAATVSAAVSPAAAASAPAAPGAPLAAPHGSSVRLDAVLADRAVPSDRGTAFAGLYRRWGVTRSAQDAALGCETDRTAELRCLPRRGTWKMLRRLNLPAVLELVLPSGVRYYAVVAALDGERATLEFGSRRFSFSLSELDASWDGAFTVMFRAPRVGAVIGPGARGRDVAWVRQQFAALDEKPAPANASEVYDDALRARVVVFQRQQLLVADGIVGDETLLRLAARRDPGAPSLSSAGTKS